MARVLERDLTLENATTPVRWWRRLPLRWGLRSLMCLIAIAAVWLAWISNQARVQRNAVAAIEKAGGKVFYDYQIKTVSGANFDDYTPNTKGVSSVPGWLLNRLGPDYFHDVKMVILFGEADPWMPDVAHFTKLLEIDFFPARKPGAQTIGPTDKGMSYLQGLTNLRHVKLSVNTTNGILGSAITGEGLAALKNARKMQILELKRARLVDSDLSLLKEMSDLRYLELDSPEIGDAGLAQLADHTKLRQLNIQSQKVTSEGIVHLSKLDQLERLNLTGTRVNNLEGFRKLSSLKDLSLIRSSLDDKGLIPADQPGFVNLSSLNLFGAKLTDAGILPLASLPQLKRLVLIDTGVTDQGVAVLKKLKPGLTIVSKPIQPTPPRRPTTPGGSPKPPETTKGQP